MYRDFSESSKQRLLGLVSEVENEKWSDFTDWIGDRWYDYEAWIGMLDIKYYINNVNLYHKKVIDKNNTTKNTIESIFSKVYYVNTEHFVEFTKEYIQLRDWMEYIEELGEIVNPANGKFTAKYISFSMGKKLEEQASHVDAFMGSTEGMYPDTSAETVSLGEALKGNETLLKNLSNVTKAAGKYGRNNQMTLSSSILGYLSALYGVASSGDKSGLGVISSILSLFQASAGVESGIYKYYEKTLHPYDFAKLDSRFGKSMAGLSIVSSFAGTVCMGINTYKVFEDSNSTNYDKVAQSIKMGGSVINLGGNVYIASQVGTKTLQILSGSSGSSRAVNQILATSESQLKYTTSAVATKNISKVSTGMAVVGVGVSTVSSGMKRYGQVASDGAVDLKDVASVGVYGSVSGLSTVASGLTLGIVSFDGEKVAEDLENDVGRFVKGDSWAAEYIRNKDNNAICRFGVSVGSAAYIIGENVVEGVENGVKTVGSWISSGWNCITSCFN